MDVHFHLPTWAVIGLLGGAHVFRVHDVKPNFEALRVALAVLEGAPGA